MPNYCENDLYLSGPEEKVNEVLRLIGADETPPRFDFNAVLPYPHNFAVMDAEREELGSQAYLEKYGTTEDGFNMGGYAWRCENWGVKWNASGVARRDYRGNVCLTFQTAWDTPTPLITALAKRFPEVTFSVDFFDSGDEVCGGFTIPSEEEADPEDGYPAGAVSSVWRGIYKGSRGG